MFYHNPFYHLNFSSPRVVNGPSGIIAFTFCQHRPFFSFSSAVIFFLLSVNATSYRLSCASSFFPMAGFFPLPIPTILPPDLFEFFPFLNCKICLNTIARSPRSYTFLKPYFTIVTNTAMCCLLTFFFSPSLPFENPKPPENFL